MKIFIKIFFIYLLTFTASFANCLKGDCISGLGTFKNNNYVYVGNFKYGKYSGQGNLTYANGRQYIGLFYVIHLLELS